MKKSYYLFNPGRLSRKDNTLKFLPVDEEGREGKPKYLPVEDIKNLFCFGSLDANSALYSTVSGYISLTITNITRAVLCPRTIY